MKEYHNLWDIMEIFLGVKFITLNTHIRKETYQKIKVNKPSIL